MTPIDPGSPGRPADGPDWAGAIPRGGPYPVDVLLRWSDMDTYGHVNNVEFLRLIEDARVRAICAWFGSPTSLDAWPVVVARSEIDYLAPLTYRVEPVRVHVRVSAFTDIGYDMGYEIRDPPGLQAKVYARAETMMVAYNVDLGTPRMLSAYEESIYRQHLAEPVRLRSRPARLIRRA